MDSSIFNDYGRDIGIVLVVFAVVAMALGATIMWVFQHAHVALQFHWS